MPNRREKNAYLLKSGIVCEIKALGRTITGMLSVEVDEKNVVWFDLAPPTDDED